MPLVLALDVGTSSVKGALVDSQTTELVSPTLHETYALDFPTPDAAEIGAGTLWKIIAQVIRKTAGEAKGRKIEGLGLSCLTPALVLLDKKDEPLAPILTHLDRRSRQIAARVEREAGAEFLATTGNRPLPGGMSALSFARLAQADPSLSPRVSRYLHLNGWLGLKLTGEAYFDPANASFTGLFDTMGSGGWSERWLGYFGASLKWLPSVVSGDTTIGACRETVSAELGLPPGIPVKLGTADTSSAMLAVGLKEGEIVHSIGTTQVLAALVARPKPSLRRLVRRFGVGAGFVHVTHNPVGGAAVEWIRRLCFAGSGPEFYDDIVPRALARKTTVTLDPPYLGGDRLEIEECLAAFTGLSLSTQKEDLLAALLQAMRRGHHEALAALGVPLPPSRIYLTGGGAPLVHRFLLKDEGAPVVFFESGALRGVARLFQGG